MIYDDTIQCTNCGQEKYKVPGQWWQLTNYFGVSGRFCPHCYKLVAHDSYGQPENPEQFKAIFVKQQIEKATR